MIYREPAQKLPAVALGDVRCWVGTAGRPIPINRKLKKIGREYPKLTRNRNFCSQLKERNRPRDALAEEYIQRARREPQKWTHLLKAHALFNSCAARAERDECKLEWEKKAYHVEALHFREHPLTEHQCNQLNAQHRKTLAAIREEMRAQLRQVYELVESMCEDDLTSPQHEEAERNFVELIKRISKSCTNKMVMLIEAIIKRCFELVKEPPCAMAVVGLGSIARGETTPYSDLEYLFLVADSQYNGYFEELAIASYFLIGNLHETNLKCLSISELSEGKWFDDSAQSGLKIDGIGGNAGNIPTGNEDQTKYFIRTPQELAEDYSKCYSKPETDGSKIIGDLSDLLASTRLLYSHQDGAKLLDEFKDRIARVQPTPARIRASLELLIKDSAKYDFFPTDYGQSNSRQLSVKYDIFRFPSILVDDTKILYRFTVSGREAMNEDAWETLDKIVQIFQWASDTAHSMLFLLAVAMYVRFDAYLHYNSQKDKLTVLHHQNCESAGRLYQFPRKLFHAYASFLFPTKHTFLIMSAFDSAMSTEALGRNVTILTESMFSGLRIQRDTKLAKLYTHAFCLEWEKCLQHMQLHWGKSLQEPVPAGLMSHAHIALLNLAAVAAINWGSKSGLEDACTYCSIALDIQSSDAKMDPEQKMYLVGWANLMGQALQGKGQYEEALNKYTEALNIVTGLTAPGAVSMDLANCYSNVGSSMFALGRHTEALEYHEKALDICKRTFGEDAVNNYLAGCYNNVGGSMLALGRHKEGFVCQEKALDIKKRLFGEDAVNEDLAIHWSAVGVTHFRLRQFVPSLLHLTHAMTIFQKLGNLETTIAVSELMIMCSLFLNDHPSSLRYSIQSVRFYEQLMTQQFPCSVDVRELEHRRTLALQLMADCVAYNARNIADIWQEYRSKQD